MSLKWPASEPDIIADAGRLHALVIGVGDYPHLLGGSGPTAKDPLNLTQVTTPRFTAERVVRWLQDEYKHPQVPLGSVEWLVSGLPGDQADPATMHNVVKAANRWKRRCDSHPDNVAFFYFCGHGLAKDYQFLLPQDFGDPDYDNAWEQCINFDLLRTGMRSCKADTQLFFVDACRETPFGMLNDLAVTGRAIFSAEVSDLASTVATYYATVEGKQAFGPPDGPTYFCDALLSCLGGPGAVNESGQWVVNTFSLASAMGQASPIFSLRHRKKLSWANDVSGPPRTLHVPGKAAVFASLACSSPAADAAAELVLRGPGPESRSPAGSPRPAVFELQPGMWQVEVTFPGGQFPGPLTLDLMLFPPVFKGVPLP